LAHPAAESAKAGRTRGKALRQIGPPRTRAQHPQDAIERRPVAVRNRPAATVGTRQYIRDQRLQNCPLFVGQLFSFCHAEKLAWQFQKVQLYYEMSSSQMLVSDMRAAIYISAHIRHFLHQNGTH
jgi:hypothetical protein